MISTMTQSIDSTHQAAAQNGSINGVKRKAAELKEADIPKRVRTEGQGDQHLFRSNLFDTECLENYKKLYAESIPYVPSHHDQSMSYHLTD